MIEKIREKKKKNDFYNNLSKNTNKKLKPVKVPPSF